VSGALLQGDARDLPLANGSVQCVVTSPPYWGLRDYSLAPSVWDDGWHGVLGLEPTPELYVQHLVECFREIRRVLRADGVVWLNLGDSYAGTPSGQNGTGLSTLRQAHDGTAKASMAAATVARCAIRESGLKPKDLVGIPWRLAFALQADGWYLRADVIWAKPNPMPESVMDRPTKAHEYLFLLAKRPTYFYDAVAIKEPATYAGTWVKTNGADGMQGFGDGMRTREGFRRGMIIGEARNRRSVWTIATEPYPEAHFATFPEALVVPCVLAGTSEAGACAACGAPWERVVAGERQPWLVLAEALQAARLRAGLSRRDLALRLGIPSVASITDWESGGHVPGAAHWERLARVLALPMDRQAFLDTHAYIGTPYRSRGKYFHHDGRDGTNTYLSRASIQGSRVTETTGWRPTCGCGTEATRPSVVLDPFAGSGTVGEVAERLGRDWVCVDLSAPYSQLARMRTRQRGLRWATAGQQTETFRL
jgi:DNA modification methylase/transcriptional regulator with XRE-family HTH domain